MRFRTAAVRLTSSRQLPDPLPPPPGELQPMAPAGAAGDLRAERTGWPAAIRESAVLVLLYPDALGEARTVLTVRPAEVRRHAGEISFPGGLREPTDGSPEAAALREAREEVGLDAQAAGVRLLGRLDEVVIGPTGFRLVPILALAAHEPRLIPDAREVAAIITPPLSVFLPGAPITMREAELDGWRLRFGAYVVEGQVIWGATARILGQLGALVGPDEDPSPAPA
ncbi:MAG: NUDIX hydrolase [Candidatus Limnocylindrales bacterium]